MSTLNPAKSPVCRHGFAVDECPHPAIVCNYSHDYSAARHVPPPPGAALHPKQIEWAREHGARWAEDA